MCFVLAWRWLVSDGGGVEGELLVLCRRCWGSTSASLGILMLADIHWLLLISCINKLNIHGGNESDCRWVHLCSERILLSRSACWARDCSRLFQSAKMCPLHVATASAEAWMRCLPTGLRHEPQLVRNTTPELSHTLQNIILRRIQWRSSIAMVSGSVSFTNISLSKNWWIVGLHLPVTCSPAAQNPKPASPEASDFGSVLLAFCCSSLNQIGAGLYNLLVKIVHHHLSCFRSALEITVMGKSSSTPFWITSWRLRPWMITTVNQFNVPSNDFRDAVLADVSASNSSNRWM